MASSHSSSQKNEEYHASSVASSSSSHAQDEDGAAFSGIVPHIKRRNCSEPSRLYDVFINHRGPDVKNSLTLRLYNSLTKLEIRAYLDKKEKELGESFPSSIEAAIRSAAVHIAIFSKGYADSPWCLAELVLMLQTRAKIIPLFYGVEPSSLRFVEKGDYDKAFKRYEEKNRYMEKLKEWKEALQYASYIAGEVVNSFSDSECEKIVLAVQKEVEKINRALIVAKHPVGFPKLVEDFEKQCMDKLVHDFEGQCGMNKQREDKAKIVGIFGIGGVGKTTLSKAYFNGKRSSFHRSCFLFDVREACVKNDLPCLQMQLLRDLFDETVPRAFSSVEEGIVCLSSHFRRSSSSSFLIILDNIDHQKQLDALLFSDELNKSGDSLVIVTTHDVGLLIHAGIGVGYHMKGMDRVYAKELFCWHAFTQANPRSGYERLVDLFVDMCGGLPLSLQVLGRHVHGEGEEFWEQELEEVKKTLPEDIRKRLRISIDTLDNEEKQIFMDIACCFIGEIERDAINVWKASGWNAQHALRRLKYKCLVERDQSDHRWYFDCLSSISSDEKCVLRMHDHLRDLGREMADEPCHEHHDHRRRLWRSQHLQPLISKGLANIFTQTKARCLGSFSDPSGHFYIKFFLGETDTMAETSTALLWLELDLRVSNHTNIPAEIPLRNLHFLRITRGRLETLWLDEVQVPFLLKELQLFYINLPRGLNLSPLRNLEKVTIAYCGYVESVTGIADLAELIEFNIIECGVEKFDSDKGSYLKNLNINRCSSLKEINFVNLRCLEKIKISTCIKLQSLVGTSYLRQLVELEIARCPCLQEISFAHLSYLKRIRFACCDQLQSLIGTSYLRQLEELEIGRCPCLQEISFAHLSCLLKIKIYYCSGLRSLIGTSDLRKLVELQIVQCPYLAEISFDQLSCLEKIEISDCSGLWRLIGTSDLRKLVELKIAKWPSLNEISFDKLSCLLKIKISHCSGLRSLIGTSDLRKLVELQIVECPYLAEISFDQLSCLEKIEISDCSGLWRLIGTSDLRKLVELKIAKCPSLNEICFDQLSNLEKFTICGVHWLNLRISDLRNLEELKIEDCHKLEGIFVFHLNWLKELTISNCSSLKSLAGTSDLRKLVELQIAECQNIEDLSLVELGCLEKIMISDCFNLRSVTLFHLKKLAQFNFNGRGPIDELSLVQVSSLERFRDFYTFYPKINEVEGCEKQPSLIFNIAKLNICDCPKLSFFPQSVRLMTVIFIERPLSRRNIKLTLQCCRASQTVAGMGDFTDCPELQFEKLCFGRLSWLEIIEIDSCEKMQKISGIERLHSLERLQLLYCSKETIQSCIRKMKKLPSDFTQVIGRPIDGAESTLNATIFSDANICLNSVIEFGSDDTCNEGYATAIILCAVLVISTSNAAKQINAAMGECDCNPWQKSEMRQGKWIITSVTTNQDEVHGYILNKGYIFHFEDFFGDGTVRKGYKMTVTMRKSEEHKILDVVRKIVDLLYL